MLLGLALALAVGADAATAGPARIAIDDVTRTQTGFAVTWHAAASGRYTVWIGGSYCGDGRRGAAGRYVAPRRRTIRVESRRSIRSSVDVRVCLRTTLSDAVHLPGRPHAQRISVERVQKRGGSWTLIWHAAESGRFAVWVRGTYCGGGAKAAAGTYDASSTPAVRTTLKRSLVRPGVSVRICLRTSHGLLSDAVRAGKRDGDELLTPPGDNRWAFYSVVALAGAAFVVAWIAPFVWKRRRRRQ